MLSPSLVEYFYHGGVGREKMFIKFEVFIFIGSQSRDLKSLNIKGIRVILSMALRAAMLRLFVPGGADSKIVG